MWTNCDILHIVCQELALLPRDMWIVKSENFCIPINAIYVFRGKFKITVDKTHQSQFCVIQISTHGC